MEADETFPEQARRVFTGLLEHCRAAADRIAALEAEIVTHARRDDTARRLATVPDRNLQCIAERGRVGRQKASGYDRRALVEADVARWGASAAAGCARGRTDGRRATEAAIAADVPNRVPDRGRPEYVRIA